MKLRILIVTFVVLLTERAHATEEYQWEGLSKAAVSTCSLSTNGWGYNTDSLNLDIARWAPYPWVQVDSIGHSVQARPIYMLTITNSETPATKRTSQPYAKPRIFIHARTHPWEVQSSWVVNKIIEFIIDTTQTSRQLRDTFIFNIVPMYNPDGVELGCRRLNADNVDLEADWESQVPAPERHALQSAFESAMAGSSPIQVALNLHSSINLCSRFFYFHHQAGTSPAFAESEKLFISKARSHFPGGIMDWDFIISWQNSPGYQYPEGWFWQNYGESVMALTYEDANCPDASGFDSTARALVLGSRDFILSKLLPVNGTAPSSQKLRPIHNGWLLPHYLKSSFWQLLTPSGTIVSRGQTKQGIISPQPMPGGVYILRVDNKHIFMVAVE